MKLTTTILLCSFLMILPARSAQITIEVEDFEFDPAIFTVNVGDTIFWVWEDGIHTTTSTLIPSGAPAWDREISETSGIFWYIPTVPGSYDYECVYHSSMNMIGHFTVNNVTGVEPVNQTPLRLRSNYVTDFLNFDQEGNVKQILPVVRDLTGKIVKRFDGSTMQSTNQFYVGDLKNGIYIFQLLEGERHNNYRFIKY